MQHLDNVQDNLKKLADIKEKNPSATHVYLRRTDKDNAVVDVPIGQAEFTIRNRPQWELVASNKQMDDEVEKLFREPIDNGSSSEPLLDIEVDKILRFPVEIVVPPKPSDHPLEKAVMDEYLDKPNHTYTPKKKTNAKPKPRAKAKKK